MEFESFVVHTCAVWRTRHNYIHSDKKSSISTDIGWIASFLQDFRKARLSELVPSFLERGKPEIKWKPPSSSYFKLNVDAKVNEDRHLYSIGGVVGDK